MPECRARNRSSISHASSRRYVVPVSSRTRLIVVTGDHGQAFGYPPKEYVSGQTVYEEDVHVPLLVCTPQVQGGRSRARGREPCGSGSDDRRSDRSACGSDWQGRSLSTRVIRLVRTSTSLKIISGLRFARRTGAHLQRPRWARSSTICRPIRWRSAMSPRSIPSAAIACGSVSQPGPKQTAGDTSRWRQDRNRSGRRAIPFRSSQPARVLAAVQTCSHDSWWILITSSRDGSEAAVRLLPGEEQAVRRQRSVLRSTSVDLQHSSSRPSRANAMTDRRSERQTW